MNQDEKTAEASEITAAQHTAVDAAIARTMAEPSRNEPGLPAAEIVPVESPEDLELLRKVVANPKILEDKTFELTEAQLIMLQRNMNPYRFQAKVGNDGGERDAAISTVNLRTEFAKKFCMTSLVGFIFQMCDEWAVPKDQRSWTPEKNDAPMEDFWKNLPMLITGLTGLQRIAESAAEAHARHEQTKTAIANKELVLVQEKAVLETQDDADKEAVRKNIKALSTDLVELRKQVVQIGKAEAATAYGCIETLSRMGAKTATYLESSVEYCQKYPEVAAEIKKTNKEVKKIGQVEMPAPQAKKIIHQFLTHWLTFDPNVHVKSARNGESVETASGKAGVEAATEPPTFADTLDPDRTTVEELLQPQTLSEEDAKLYEALRREGGEEGGFYQMFAKILKRPKLNAIVKEILSESDREKRFRGLVSKFIGPTKFALTHVPPQDTFSRLSFYMTVNYEELLTATSALYRDMPDLDTAIVIWDVFSGTDETRAKAFQEFCEANESDAPTDLVSVRVGRWTIIADHKKNRDKVNFYNKNTAVLKSIMDRHAQDARIGKELMQKRVMQRKAENIQNQGPDAPGLGNYKINAGTAQKGMTEALTRLDRARLALTGGDVATANELKHFGEVDAKIKELELTAQSRVLTGTEQRSLKELKKERESTLDMFDVPQDAIRVDLITHDAAKGTVGRSAIFTEAEAPRHMQKLHDTMNERKELAPHAAQVLQHIVDQEALVQSGAASAGISSSDSSAPSNAASSSTAKRPARRGVKKIGR